MATKKSQRIAIWVIAAVMALGSLGFYFLIIIENNNMAREQVEMQKLIEEQQARAAKPAEALKGYEATPFDAAAVTELKIEDIKVGEGEEVPAGASVEANYMGWLPDGTLFDSSNRGGEAKPVPFSLNGVIPGWREGVPGMKVGGVRKLTIPAVQAYGETGSQSIPPNTPLTFIIELTKVEK